MTIALKPAATLADFQRIADLARTVWRGYFAQRNIISAGQVDYMLARFYSPEALAEAGDEKLYLIERAGEPAGLFSCRDDEGGARICKLFIVEACRGQGIARHIVEGLPGRVWLLVNKRNRDAVRAYERMGFSIIGEQKTDIGCGYVMDDWLMERAASQIGAADQGLGHRSNLHECGVTP